MDAIDYLGEAKHSDIEFTHGCIVPMRATDEYWSLYIFLNYPILLSPLLQESLNLLKIIEYPNSPSSIRILPWLTNPNPLRLFMILIQYLFKLVVSPHIPFSRKRISNRQYLINIFINHFFIEYTHCLIQITLVCYMVIPIYLSIYLLRIDLF